MSPDSTGKPISIGDRVRFRGQVFTIKGFRPGEGRFGSAVVEFEEVVVHTNETPDEIGIDRI